MTTRPARWRTVEEAQTRQLPDRHQSMADLGHTDDGRDRGRRKPLRSFAMRAKDDDLLKGFSVEGSTVPENRPPFVSTIGSRNDFKDSDNDLLANRTDAGFSPS